jgi:O-Antigen ligase
MRPARDSALLPAVAVRPAWRAAEPRVAVLTAAIALLGGAMAVRSPQAAAAIALLVMLLAVHSQSRRMGFVGLWLIWLLAPGLRRVLALAGDTPSADPLALLPFVATGLLALIELRRSNMSAAARKTLTIAALGFLLGAPIGFLADPLSFGFGIAAYIAGLAALVIGWSDASDRGSLTLVRTLAVALPPLAVYGILQYFLPLTEWDSNWINTVELGSIGAPQEGHIRVFSTLNSPGTFAIVLAAGILLGLGAHRRFGSGLVSTLPLVVALALTFVRSAWLGLAVGLIVYAAAVRGRAAGRVVRVIVVCLVALIVVGGSNPTTRAFTERLTSLGGTGKDVSATQRLNTTSQLLPTAIQQPLGAGIGQAGLSARLDAKPGDSQSLLTTDNGYLALMYQVGPIGFLLVVIAMGWAIGAALRALRAAGADGRQAAAAVLGALAMILVAEASGDMLYGVTGAIFWYLAGSAFASSRPSLSSEGDPARSNDSAADGQPWPAPEDVPASKPRAATGPPAALPPAAGARGPRPGPGPRVSRSAGRTP